jgi:FkbM family methyltransferase
MLPTSFNHIRLPNVWGTLAFLAAWVTPFRLVFRVRSRTGLSFYVHHRDAIGRHIAKYGMHEPLVTQWIADYLDSAKEALVVDVGANLGWHAMHAARHPNVATVVAFEPDPFNAWLLERNMIENDVENLILDVRCVGAAPSVVKLYRYKSSNAGRHSVAADHGYGARSVPMTDLDGALAALGLGERRVALIKIDVEGYEPAVIAGARRTLERTDALILEHSPDWSRRGGLPAEKGLHTLAQMGFAPYALLAGGGLARTNIDALLRFEGSLDVVFMRTGPLSMAAAGGRELEAPDLQAIAERNKLVK